MAIQNRRGKFEDFDPEKLLPGEWACVTTGDPDSNSGASMYICFSAGKVKRMATYEDMASNVSQATEDIREAFLGDIENATASAESAANTANSSAQNANSAAQRAEGVANEIEAAVQGTVINDNTPSELTVYSSKYVEDNFLKSGGGTFLEEDGDGSELTSSYEEPETETAPESGSKLRTLFGWLMKKSKQIGTLAMLATEAKDSIVSAINELVEIAQYQSESTGREISGLHTQIGDLESLSTEDKTSLVGAINETNAGLSELDGKIPEESTNYIKFADGTLIQWGTRNSPGSGAGYAEIAFPVPFASTNYSITVTPQYFSSTYPAFLVSVAPTAVDKCGVYFRQAWTNAVITGVTSRWIAIGKWK